MKKYLITFLYPIPGARMYRPKSIEIEAASREEAEAKFKVLYPNIQITKTLEKKDV